MFASRPFAQAPPDPAANARVHIGPLALSPAISLLNAGVDTNVFNEADQLAPKSDFTMTVQPKTDLWLHLGRSMLVGNVTEDLVYYRKYASERSMNHSYKLGLLVPWTRLTLNGAVSYLNTRERPGFEIDARSQRTEVGYDAGVEIRALPKTTFGLRGQRTGIDFDSVATFEGVSLQDALNRTVTTSALTIRHQSTPLTSVTLEVGRDQDRFRFSPVRDSDSTHIVGSVKFDPFALINGGASVGYRDFKPRSAGVPAYRGAVASVDLSYTVFDSTRFSVQGTRDVQYSFDLAEPYYVLTGWSGSIAQQVFGPVDVVGRYGAQRLDYRQRAGADPALTNRTDYTYTYGGGVGYHLGTDVRIGFNVDKSKRTSAVSNRSYSGLRYGAAVTYGL